MVLVSLSLDLRLGAELHSPDVGLGEKSASAAAAAAACSMLTACLLGSDIVFALDSSGSIGQQNVQQMTRFLELLINSLNVNANDTDHTVSRVGMLTYADTATIQFQLNTFRKRTEILQAISVRYSGGTTNAADAIRYNSSWLLTCIVLRVCYVLISVFFVLVQHTVFFITLY